MKDNLYIIRVFGREGNSVIQTHNKKWWNEFKNKEPNLYNYGK
jgi:hypothetical protein